MPVFPMQPGEMGAGVRLGGVLGGPGAQAGRLPIWNGRPPVDSDGTRMVTLFLSATGGSRGTGDTVEVIVECGNGWGGKVSRTFRVGAGLSAELRVGHFQNVHAYTAPEGLPAGMKLYFTWSPDWMDQSPLIDFLDYPVINTVIGLPEGCAYMTPQAAGVITFQLPEFGTTFPVSVAAGQRIPASWGAFSCNTVNRFILEMRGL